MTITDKAVEYFKKELNEMNLDTIVVNISTSCCAGGYGIHIGYMNSDSNIIINGLKIKFDGPSDIFSSLKIDVKGEMLIFD